MTKHVECELTTEVRELTADELECVSGGKPASKDSSGSTYLSYNIKMVYVTSSF
jgi:hypothetical protein